MAKRTAVLLRAGGLNSTCTQYPRNRPSPNARGPSRWDYGGLLLKPGDDVLVSLKGGEFPGEVLKVEGSGYVLCRIHSDPAWDFGGPSARVDPEQIVAVRMSAVRPA